MLTIRPFAVVLLLAFSAAPVAFGASYVVPRDAEMIQGSDDVVVATGVASLVERREDGAIVTRYTLRIEEVLKGSRRAGEHLVLTERGGAIGDRVTFIPGTPAYEPGERYLVFTAMNRFFEPVTYGMELGQFRLVQDGSRMLALRSEMSGYDENLELHSEGARDAAGFMAYVRGIVARSIDPAPAYFVARPKASWRGSDKFPIQSLFTRSSYLMSASGRAFRYSNPTATFRTSRTAVAQDGIDAVNNAFSQWNGTASNIHYTRGAQDDTAEGGIKNGVDTSDGKNAIMFEDPFGQVPAGGVVGVGGITSGGNPYTLDGEDFWDILEADVVMNPGSTFTAACFRSVLVHELGHTLGFRHSNTPPSGGESSTNAIMNSTVTCSANGTLKTWDNNAASTVYGTGPVCGGPTINTHPASKTIDSGASTTLTVSATASSGSLTYQWFRGASPDTSDPVGTSSSSFNTGPLTVTTSFWVRVTDTCGTGNPKNSNTATVTIAACTPPSITSHPQNKTISFGGSTSISVSATGTTPRTVQWFIGTSPDDSSPTGSNNTSLSVSPGTTTSYWARVSNACGSANSNTAIVTVTTCPSVSVSAAASAVVAGSATLTATGSSVGQTLSYSWFRGDTPGVGGTQVGTQRVITIAVTEAASYWVRARNECDGSAVSNLVTVAPCTLPSILTQPADQQVQSGASATLSLVLPDGALGVTTTWYRGAVGDKTTQVGTGTSILVGPLTEDASFWAELRNACGAIASNAVNVRVLTCAPPSITTQPQSQSIKGGRTLTLSVGATGAGTLQFQWYEGVANATDRPVGTNSSTLEVRLIAKSTSYWVRVTGECGAADSAIAEITVTPSRHRSVMH